MKRTEGNEGKRMKESERDRDRGKRKESRKEENIIKGVSGSLTSLSGS